MFTVKLVKTAGKLVYPDDKSKLNYQIFVDKLAEGQEVEMFIDIVTNKASNSQIAKVHACIRELASESGYNFDEMKTIIKDKTGLYSHDEHNSRVYKSFGNCSKDEIALAIEACIAIGRDNYNMNLT